MAKTKPAQSKARRNGRKAKSVYTPETTHVRASITVVIKMRDLCAAQGFSVREFVDRAILARIEGLRLRDDDATVTREKIKAHLMADDRKL